MIARLRRSAAARGRGALLAAHGRVALRLTRRPRTARWRGLRLHVPVGVFHPGLYLSSHALAAEVAGLVAAAPPGRTVLDVGTGSGLVALAAARAGADVTAVDLNPAAVEAARANAARAGLDVDVAVSDLFGALGARRFDLVVSNPPYFRRDPADLAEAAWHAGADLGWFDRFFAGLGAHLAPGGAALLVLGEHCELDVVHAAAERHGQRCTERCRVRHPLGTSVLLDVRPIAPAPAGATAVSPT